MQFEIAGITKLAIKMIASSPEVDVMYLFEINSRS